MNQFKIFIAFKKANTFNKFRFKLNGVMFHCIEDYREVHTVTCVCGKHSTLLSDMFQQSF